MTPLARHRQSRATLCRRATRDAATQIVREVYAAHQGEGRRPGLDHAGRARRRCRRGAQPRRRGPALRHSLRGQGQHRRCRPADDLRLSRVCLCAGAFGDGRRAAWSRPAPSSSARPISISSPPAWSARARPTASRRACSTPTTSRGGSSSGSAVAVAAGWCRFALGTDTAGSGRVPAAFNNIVGLKPTKGLISTRGVVPACRTQDTVSIFALTVGDAAKVAMSLRSRSTRRTPSREPRRTFRGRRGAGAAQSRCPKRTDRLLRRCGLREALSRCHRRGWRRSAPASSRSTSRPSPRRPRLLYAGPWVAERLAAIGDFANAQPRGDARGRARHHPRREGARARSSLRGLLSLLPSSCARRGESGRRWTVMLLPTAGTTYKIARVLADPVALNSNLGAYTNFVNLMDLAALAVPAGFRPTGFPSASR